MEPDKKGKKKKVKGAAYHSQCCRPMLNFEKKGRTELFNAYDRTYFYDS